MGGPFLEDTRFMYTEVGVTKLLSIERGANAFRRQRFNRPFPFVTCCHCSVSEMIDRYDECIENLGNPENVVVWLDYQDAKREGQLADIRELSTVLAAYDVIRVTMNANVDSVDRVTIPEDATPFAITDQEEEFSDVEVKKRERARKLRHQLGDFAPNFSPDDMTSKGLPSLLSQAVHLALRAGVSDGLVVQPLANNWYADQQHMVTVTAAIWPVAEVDRCLEAIGLANWPFATPEPADLIRVAVPALSFRERIELDRIVESTFLVSKANSSGDIQPPPPGQQPNERAGYDNLGGAPEAIVVAIEDEAGLETANEDQHRRAVAELGEPQAEEEAEPTVSELFDAEELEQYRDFQRYYPVYARLAI
jgi:hypothetical protein